MSVRLRQRPQASGRTSLFLVIKQDGKTRTENLKLYLYPSNSPQQRKENKETLALAEAIKSERLLEVQKGRYGYKTYGKNKDKDFIEFFQKLMDERRETTSNYDNWYGTFKHLKAYCGGIAKFGDITPKFLEGFKSYLASAKMRGGNRILSQNSGSSYFNKLRAAINRAFEEGMLDENPIHKVRGIPHKEGKREYLTEEEVRTLSQVDCKYPILKRAFMFGIITGLRWSDVNRITWGQVQNSKSLGWVLTFRQQKTDQQEHLPINEQALIYMGSRGTNDQRIFEGLKYSAYMNVELSRWVLAAGITKKITFHCARHTHATMLLSNNVDIYTVSKMLGHRHLKTTEIYAKVIDQRKLDAVKSFPTI